MYRLPVIMLLTAFFAMVLSYATGSVTDKKQRPARRHIIIVAEPTDIVEDMATGRLYVERDNGLLYPCDDAGEAIRNPEL